MAKYVHFQSSMGVIPEEPEDTRHWSVEEEFDARMLLTHPHQFSDAEDDSSESEAEETDQEPPLRP